MTAKTRRRIARLLTITCLLYLFIFGLNSKSAHALTHGIVSMVWLCAAIVTELYAMCKDSKEQ